MVIGLTILVFTKRFLFRNSKKQFAGEGIALEGNISKWWAQQTFKVVDWRRAICHLDEVANMEGKFKPLGDRVLISYNDGETKTEIGLILTDSAQRGQKMWEK